MRTTAYCLLFFFLIAVQAATLSHAYAQTARAPRSTDVKLALSVSIEMPNSDPVTASSEIIFIDAFAVASALSEDPNAEFDFRGGTVFNLETPSWHNAAKGVWVDLAACHQWETASHERTKRSLEQAPEDIRTAVQAMIKPDFQVNELPDGNISISNARLKYVITPDSDVPQEILKRFFEYDRLNAYHKAMNEKGFPPTPQLAVTKILEKRGEFPRKIAASIWSPNGDVKVVGTMRIEDPEPEDVSEAAIAVQKTTDTEKP